MALHRFVLITLSVLGVLMMMGGIVHNTDSSLVCPDWPGCGGQLLPLKEVHLGMFLEHYSHRMLGMTLGILSIILCVLLALRAYRRSEPALYGLGFGTVAMVSLVGALGRYTVLERLSWWASSLKLSLAAATFILLIYTYKRVRPTPTRAPLSLRARAWTLVAVTAVFAQMVLGALVRHRGAGLACLEVPLCRGEWWPSDAHRDVLLHVVHRLAALVVLVLVGWGALVIRRSTPMTSLRRMALVGPLLVLVQGALGVWSIFSLLDVVPRTAHLGVAILLLGHLVSLHLAACGTGSAATTTSSDASPSMEALA